MPRRWIGCNLENYFDGALISTRFSELSSKNSSFLGVIFEMLLRAPFVNKRTITDSTIKKLRIEHFCHLKFNCVKKIMSSKILLCFRNSYENFEPRLEAAALFRVVWWVLVWPASVQSQWRIIAVGGRGDKSLKVVESNDENMSVCWKSMKTISCVRKVAVLGDVCWCSFVAAGNFVSFVFLCFHISCFTFLGKLCVENGPGC